MSHYLQSGASLSPHPRFSKEGEGAMSMNLNRLKWVAIAMPLAFVVFLRLTTEGVLAPFLDPWPASLVFDRDLHFIARLERS